MRYRIRALKCGECDVRDYISFFDGGEETRPYFLYLWLLEGGPAPMVVDTGVNGTVEFGAGTASYIPGGLRQRLAERTPAALAAAGVDIRRVSHVFATHFHRDHYDALPLFPDAMLVAHRTGFDQDSLLPEVRAHLDARGPESVLVVGDGEVMPGISVMHVGVHSACSTAVCVDTSVGRAVLAGDVVYLYANLEPDDHPPGWVDVAAWREAAGRIRSAGDFVLPSHDPLVLSRWPSGAIG